MPKLTTELGERLSPYWEGERVPSHLERLHPLLERGLSPLGAAPLSFRAGSTPFGAAPLPFGAGSTPFRADSPPCVAGPSLLAAALPVFDGSYKKLVIHHRTSAI